MDFETTGPEEVVETLEEVVFEIEIVGVESELGAVLDIEQDPQKKS